MSTALDLDDCVSNNPMAIIQLAELRESNKAMTQALKSFLKDYDEICYAEDMPLYSFSELARAALGLDKSEEIAR